MLIPKKYHIHVIALLAVSAILFLPQLTRKIDPEILAEGTAAAEEFLVLIDAEQYAEAREVASDLLKDKIAIEVWHRQIGVMRDRVGRLTQRALDKSFLSEIAEGAPEGEYLTLKYMSFFEQQSEASETVILTREKDGEWRVVGYFIK